MKVSFARRADGSTVLRCTRADGSESWQRQEGPRALFFALHDLTHFAVEQELGFDHGFFGLVAGGWEIDDTSGKGRRGPLPDEAVAVEQLVGAMGLEQGSGARWSAAEFNEHAAAFARDRGRIPPRALGDEELERVRRRIAELGERWARLEAGEALVLDFTPVAR